MRFRDLLCKLGWTFRFSSTMSGKEGTMIADEQLSEHFSLYDMTTTTHADLLEMNRNVDEYQIQKLRLVADLWEQARAIIDAPIIISSGYRCPALNQRVGSTLRSQHLLCEAADGVPRGIAVDEAFRKLRAAAKDGTIEFGQLIFEKANRQYAGEVVEWIHLSLGFPYRPEHKCGQILTMNDGAYILLETV